LLQKVSSILALSAARSQEPGGGGGVGGPVDGEVLEEAETGEAEDEDAKKGFLGADEEDAF